MLTNAAEGNGRSRATAVTVRTWTHPETGRVQIQVEDDGPGIAQTPTVIDSSPRSSKPGGTGIGLAVVQGIAEASNGDLRVGERDGGGTRVTVSLPAAGA